MVVSQSSVRRLASDLSGESEVLIQSGLGEA